MHIDGAEGRPGTALLLAAAPTGKGKLTEASSVIPVLAAVSPAALAGTATATLIELTDPVDPQALLTRVRGAAATEGPLTVMLIGQLQLDRRQQAVHLALARTTPSTIRYTAFPWAWFVSELQKRRPDTTTLYLDLVADAEVWQLLDEEPLPLPGGARTYGLIAAPPPRRGIAHPAYTHALAQILRTGQRSTPDQLHHEILRRVDAEGSLVLGPEQPAPTQALPTSPPPAKSRFPIPPQLQVQGSPPPAPPAPEQALAHRPPPSRAQQAVSPVYVPSNAVIPVEADPHQQIAALSKAGRHREAIQMAAAAEQHTVQTFGADTFAAVHWIEVRAFLFSVAQKPVDACQLWLQAAETRLDTLQQAPDTHDVETAVDRAHHQWIQLRDAATARNLAPRLIALRRRVPGRQRGALESIQKMLERLNSLPRR